MSAEARRLYFSSIRPSTRDRYQRALFNFFQRFRHLSTINVINHMATLQSSSSMEVFISAVSRFTGTSLFGNNFISRIITGKAQTSLPSIFPQVVNTIDLNLYISSSEVFDTNQKFALQLMILTCARPSDIRRLSPNSVKITGNFISVARHGTKADRRKRGHALLIPITRSVIVPEQRIMLIINFDRIWEWMKFALVDCFNSKELAPSIIRKSSACMLRQRGLANRDIMEIGGWASEDTLRRFYSRANVQWINRYGLQPTKVYDPKQWPEMLLAR
jgi:integrase